MRDTDLEPPKGNNALTEQIARTLAVFERLGDDPHAFDGILDRATIKDFQERIAWIGLKQQIVKAAVIPIATYAVYKIPLPTLPFKVKPIYKIAAGLVAGYFYSELWAGAAVLDEITDLQLYMLKFPTLHEHFKDEEPKKKKKKCI